jgi:hypothetical protein
VTALREERAEEDASDAPKPVDCNLSFRHLQDLLRFSNESTFILHQLRLAKNT